MGEVVTVFVEAQGDGLTYEWHYKEKGSTRWRITTAFTSNEYAVTMTEARDGRQLYCKITDQYGNSVTTDIVTISAAAQLEIITQPVDTSAPIGETISVFVEAQGDGLTYQWWIKNRTASSFAKSSIAAATYSMTMSAKANGRKLYCVVTDQYGNSVTTDTVTISAAALETPLEIISQPVDASVPMGETVAVSVVAQGDSLSFAWYYKDVGMAKFRKGSITTDIYSVTMTEARNGRQLYCVITDEHGGSVTTNTVTISAAANETPLTITTQPHNAYAPMGEPITVYVEAQGDGLTYQWWVKNTGASKFSVSSVKSAVYTTTMSNKANGRQIYCVITDQYGNSVTTNTVSLLAVG